ncbi:MAG: DUF4340 domain-containing protein [Planctomycetota bacterium]
MKTNLFLLVLAIALAVPTWLTVRAERASFTEIKDIPLLFDGFNPATVAVLRVAKGWNEAVADPKAQKEQKQIDELIFQRQGPDKWVLANTELAGAPVLNQKVTDELLEHLGRIRRDEKAVHRAKATPEELAQFGLDKDQGFVVTAFDSNQRVMADLVVGKDISGGQWEASRVHGRYVRAKANESVLVYETDFFSPSVTASEWLDKRIYQVDLSHAVGFTLFNATVKEPVEFKKDKASEVEWKVAKGPEGTGAPRQGELSPLAQQVSILYAERFLALMQPDKLRAKGLDPTVVGLEPPQCSFTFTLDDGESIRVDIGKKLEDKAEFYARSNKSPFLFTVPDHFEAALEVDIKGKLLDPPAEKLRDDGKDDKGNK